MFICRLLCMSRANEVFGCVSFQIEVASLLSQVLKLQSANGFGQEDSGMIIEGMATNGAEPTYCMGDDIPLPVLSSRPHHLGDYFKQRFAQVSLLQSYCAWQPYFRASL